MSVLEAYSSLSRFLPELFGKSDMAVFATDLEKFLFFHIFGRFRINLKAGDDLKPTSTPALVIKDQKAISRYVPPEVYGIVCRTICLPVSGGTIGVAFSVEKEEEIRVSLELAKDSIAQVNSSSSAIANNAQAVVAFMGTLSDTLGQTKGQLGEINAVGELIGDIAEDSRYISLNALIEANRAGEHGRSFSVVAKEMQKLSDQTHRSIQSVHSSLTKINQQFQVLEGQFSRINANLQDQSHASREIEDIIGKMSLSLTGLAQLSQML